MTMELTKELRVEGDIRVIQVHALVTSLQTYQDLQQLSPPYGRDCSAVIGSMASALTSAVAGFANFVASLEGSGVLVPDTWKGLINDVARYRRENRHGVLLQHGAQLQELRVEEDSSVSQSGSSDARDRDHAEQRDPGLPEMRGLPVRGPERTAEASIEPATSRLGEVKLAWTYSEDADNLRRYGATHLDHVLTVSKPMNHPSDPWTWCVTKRREPWLRFTGIKSSCQDAFDAAIIALRASLEIVKIR